MPSYQEQTGTRSDCTAIDSEKILSELSKGKFVINSSASTYMPEKYTIGYISSIFTAKNAIEEFWNSCVSFVSGYIDKFKNVPDPETISPDTSYLNGTAGTGEQVGYVVSDGTNVYSKPGGEVISSLAYGASVVATAKTSDNQWIQVRLSDGTTAYVPYNSLGNKPSGSTSSQSSQTTTNTASGEQTGYVVTDGTNLYSKPNGEAIGSLAYGASVVATAKTSDNQWIQVRLSDGTTAYVPYNSLGNKPNGVTTPASAVTTPQSTTPKQVTPGVGKMTGTYNGMDYYLYEPDQDGTPKSLTIFFHGNGEDGGKLSKAASYGIGKQLASGQDFDGYVLVPHNNGKWDSKKINNLIDEISEKYNIDKNRISLAGYSNGANPVSELVRENPNKFSAVAFIGSYVDNDSTAKALVNTPTRFLTGKGNSGATKHSESMVAKIENAGGTSASMDVYKGYGHENPFVTMLYNDGGLYEWLTSQSRAKTT